jgi:hypothetical protein
MLQPLQDVPFNLVIEALTGKKYIIDFTNQNHIEVLRLLKESAFIAGREMNKKGIQRAGQMKLEMI